MKIITRTNITKKIYGLTSKSPVAKHRAAPTILKWALSAAIYYAKRNKQTSYVMTNKMYNRKFIVLKSKPEAERYFAMYAEYHRLTNTDCAPVYTVSTSGNIYSTYAKVGNG